MALPIRCKESTVANINSPGNSAIHQLAVFLLNWDSVLPHETIFSGSPIPINDSVDSTMSNDDAIKAMLMIAGRLAKGRMCR